MDLATTTQLTGISCQFGHTKFRPDEGFGHIRRYVGRRVDAFSMNELADAITASSKSNFCVQFSIDDIFDYKSRMGKIYKPLEGIKKYFAYRLHIVCTEEDGQRSVYVDVYRSSGADRQLNQTLRLLRPGCDYPNLDGFDRDPPKKTHRRQKENVEG